MISTRWTSAGLGFSPKCRLNPSSGRCYASYLELWVPSAAGRGSRTSSNCTSVCHTARLWMYIQFPKQRIPHFVQVTKHNVLLYGTNTASSVAMSGDEMDKEKKCRKQQIKRSVYDSLLEKCIFLLNLMLCWTFRLFGGLMCSLTLDKCCRHCVPYSVKINRWSVQLSIPCLTHVNWFVRGLVMARIRFLPSWPLHQHSYTAPALCHCTIIPPNSRVTAFRDSNRSRRFSGELGGAHCSSSPSLKELDGTGDEKVGVGWNVEGRRLRWIKVLLMKTERGAR